MRNWLFILVFLFLSNAYATLSVNDIKADYQTRLTTKPTLTPLDYAQTLVIEGQALIDQPTPDQAGAAEKFRTAEGIIRGKVWGFLERQATAAEAQQYFDIIGKTGFFRKVAEAPSPLSPPAPAAASSPVARAHLQVVDTLYNLTQADEVVFFSPLPQVRASFSTLLDDPTLGSYLGTLRGLLPFKDACFGRLVLAPMGRIFSDSVGAFYGEPDATKRMALPAFQQYLSDHHLIIARDPRTGIVYVDWNIATLASTRLPAEPAAAPAAPPAAVLPASPAAVVRPVAASTNSGFALTEDENSYRARLRRIAQALARISHIFGANNVVISLQEVKNPPRPPTPPAIADGDAPAAAVGSPPTPPAPAATYSTHLLVHLFDV
jgi:hypothetical protein